MEQEGLRQEQARFLSLPDREELKRAQGDLALLKALEPEIKLGRSPSPRRRRNWNRSGPKR